jgi:hypothetical protein
MRTDRHLNNWRCHLGRQFSAFLITVVHSRWGGGKGQIELEGSPSGQGGPHICISLSSFSAMSGAVRFQ